MLIEKFSHRSWPQVSEDLRIAIAQSIGHLVIDRTLEPLIHNVDRKPAFGPFQYRLGQEGATDLPVNPFSRTISDFQIGRQSFDIFNNLFVDKRHAKLKS